MKGENHGSKPYEQNGMIWRVYHPPLFLVGNTKFDPWGNMKMVKCWSVLCKDIPWRPALGGWVSESRCLGNLFFNTNFHRWFAGDLWGMIFWGQQWKKIIPFLSKKWLKSYFFVKPSQIQRLFFGGSTAETNLRSSGLRVGRKAKATTSVGWDFQGPPRTWDPLGPILFP